jgi:hypothetical protein
MVSPSTADAEQDDATIRKLRGFSRQHGYGRFIVGNLYAYRATDVRELGRVTDPIGPENNEHLHNVFRDADDVTVAWRPLAKQPKHLRNRWRVVANLSASWGMSLKCLGMCKDGHPRHPLMTGYDTPLTEWSAP